MIKKNYIIGIEIFRIAAAFAVICIHVPPFANTEWIPNYKILYYGISHFCRFAVPFFFLVSGYFYGKSLEKSYSSAPLIFKRLKRFFFLFVTWSLIYAVLPDPEPLKRALNGGLTFRELPSIFPIVQRFYSKFQTIPLVFIFEGNTGHLWFFTALMSAYLVLYVFRFSKTDRPLIFTAGCLYLFGLLNSNYSVTPIGIHFPFVFYYRDGPFLSTLFVALGFGISKLKKIPELPAAIVLALSGFFVQELEVFSLDFFYHAGTTFDFLAGTVPFACGIFLVALNIHQPSTSKALLEISSLTLGIYVSHLIAAKIIDAFFPAPNSATWQIVFPVLIFCVSAAWTYFLKKNNFSKIFVT